MKRATDAAVKRTELRDICMGKVNQKSRKRKWSAVAFYAHGQYIAESQNEDGTHAYSDDQVALALDAIDRWIHFNGEESGAGDIMRSIIAEPRSVKPPPVTQPRLHVGVACPICRTSMPPDKLSGHMRDVHTTRKPLGVSHCGRCGITYLVSQESSGCPGCT